MRTEELDQLLQKGEGQFVEFKENLDNSIAKEIVSFSNASGGRILLGINDKNKVTGISITNKLKSQIMDIANNCDPKISLHLEEMENILIINAYPKEVINPINVQKGSS